MDFPHFGRFLVLDRAQKIEYTWMSPFTRGLESVVTVELERQGDDTLLHLRHANLPDDDLGRCTTADGSRAWTRWSRGAAPGATDSRRQTSSSISSSLRTVFQLRVVTAPRTRSLVSAAASGLRACPFGYQL